MPDARRPTPLTKPRMGLLAAADVAESVTPRWGLGVQWLPELVNALTNGGVPSFGAREIQCHSNEVDRTVKPQIEHAYPFLVYAYDNCSSFDDAGADKRDRAGRARRLLEATRSASVAREFWSGAISAAQGLNNTWLNKAGSVTVTSATTPDTALAQLDRAIAIAMSNGRAMIHCSVAVLDLLAVNNALRREGNLWLTPYDNIVVADAGYSGVGTDATSEWMYATTMVEIKFTPVVTTELEIEMVDTHLNDIVVWAQQDAIVMHEPHILWHGVKVAIPA